MWRRLLWRNRGFRKGGSGAGINRMFKRLHGWVEPMAGFHILRAAAAAALLLGGGVPSAAPSQRPAQYSQSVVREQVIVRFRQSAPARIDWKEGKGPKC